MGGVGRDRWLGGIVRVTALLSGGVTWGCPGTLDDPARFVDAGAAGAADVSAPVQGEEAGEAGALGSCPDVPALLAQTCTASTCHSASNKAQGLDLQSPDLAARLVGVPATEGPGLLVDPSAPTKSVLYAKLTANPPFEARMPLGAAPLDAPTLACVLDWVTQTAAASDDGGAE
jgi:hypothetical protein